MNIISSSRGVASGPIGLEGVVDNLRLYVEETDAWEFRKYGKIKKEATYIQRRIEAKKTDANFGPCIREIT